MSVSRRGEVLEFAVLGLLAESPMHGYELRKRLGSLLGPLRAFSYGSLYPCLKELVARDLLTQDDVPAATTSEPLRGRPSRRSKIVYRLTGDGKERFQALLAESGPSAWEDDNFGVHLAFFARTDREVRLRILEGRRSRLEERLATVRTALTRTKERVDGYTLELHRHGLESAEREVRWLDKLISAEQHDSTTRRNRSTDRSDTTRTDPTPR
ncbi:PadR family transcriptional regulator [soil metagenome]|jgi:DNA-binding PadR family transcriptional regulator